MSSVNPFRLKLSRLRNRYYFDASSSEEESVLEADNDQKESETHVASPSIASIESSVVDDDGTHSVAIIKINSVNGSYVQSSSLKLPGEVTKIDFETESITEEVIRDAAEDLLEHAREVIENTDSVQTTLVFLAGDLGGSVLKQALVEATRIPKYANVLRCTSLLMFFGTPHRSSPGCEWDYTLSNLICSQFAGLLGPWIPGVVQRLSAFHEELSAKFNAIIEERALGIVNYYQEPEPDTYEILVPRFAATLGKPREIQIGLQSAHEDLFDLYLPEHMSFLTSQIEDTVTRLGTKFQECLRLLSKHDLSVPTRSGLRPTYKNLCDWLLSDDALTSWVGTTASAASTLSTIQRNETTAQGRDMQLDKATELIPKRRKESVAKTIQVLELDGIVDDTSILTSSLIASIRSKRREYVDLFVTLAHHNPQPFSLTIAQLLASMCRQLLIGRPKLFTQVQPFLKSVQKAIQGSNSAWKEAALWRILKVLLRGQAGGQTFIVIHQPQEIVFTSPFVSLITDLATLAETSEISCKILAIRKASIDAPRNGPFTRKDANHADLQVKIALEKDFEAELDRAAQIRPHVGIIKREVLSTLSQDGIDLQTARHCIALLENQSFLTLQLVRTTLFTGMRKDVIQLVLDQVPKTVQPWVRIGLLWVTHAIRPLTCAEFAAILSNGTDDVSREISNGAVDEFVRLLCGLVEVESSTIYVTNPRLFQHVVRPSLEQDYAADGHVLNQKKSRDAGHTEEGENIQVGVNAQDGEQKELGHKNEGGKERGEGKEKEEHVDSVPIDIRRQREWYACGPDGHMDIAKDCLAYIHKHGGLGKNSLEKDSELEKGTSENDEEDSSIGKSLDPATKTEKTIEPTEDGASPLLSYATEHWFDHVKQSENLSAIRMAPVADFLADDDCVDRWIRRRTSYQLPGSPTILQPLFPRLGIILAELNLNRSNATDLVKAINILSHASAVATPSAPGLWASVSLAVSQLGDTEILQRLVDKGHLDGEQTLIAAFETGSDEALCSLVKSQGDWVRRNVHKVIRDALRMGNLGLVLAVQDEFGESISFANYQTPLIHEFAEDGSLSPPDQLWDALKLDVDSKSKGRTPLHSAATSGHFTLVPKLLSSGLETKVKINSQDSSKSSPLLLAVRTGHFTIFKRLLDAGADVNLCDDNNQTPLHAASFGGYLDIVQALLHHGAKIDLKDYQDKTALHRALENGHAEVCLTLLEQIKSLAEQQRDAASHVIIRYRKGMADNGRSNNITLTMTKGNDTAEMALALVRKEESMTVSGEGSESTSPTRVTTSSETVAITSSSVNVVAIATASTFGVDTKDKEGLTPLLLAVKGNYLSVVNALLDLGANVNQVCPLGNAPLHYAAKFDFYEVLLELLAAKGVDVSPKNDDEDTPLHLAGRWGHIRVIKKLLEKGAECDGENWDNLTPLGEASQWGRAEAVKLLLPSASPKELDDAYFQATSSTSMSTSSGMETIRQLLEAGASINLLKDTGTALHQVAYKSEPRIMQLLLLKRASLELCDDSGRTPLLDAARRNAVECVRLLIEAGANIDAEDENGRTPLFEAAVGGYTSCVAILIAANAALKIPSSMSSRYDSYTELALCEFKHEVFRMVMDKIRGGSISPGGLRVSSDVLRKYLEDDSCDIGKIRTLLDKGLDPDQRIGSYGTMLHYAALWGRLNLAELLTESNRANLNPNNREHGTPLEVAAYKGGEKSRDIVELLLTRGANVTIGGARYGSPLHAAASMPCLWDEWEPDSAEKRYLAIVRLILDRHPSAINLNAGYLGTPLQAAAQGWRASMVELLLDRSPDLNIRAGVYGTPLHAAAYTAKREIVDLILSKSEGHLTPATTDPGGRIPLHMAAMKDHVFLIDTLATDPVSFLTPDLEGRHSLHFAAARGSTDFARRILDKHKGTVQDVDADGWTPLHWACRRDNTAMVSLLISCDADKEAETNRGWKPVHVAMYHRAIFKDPGKIIELVRPSSWEDEETSQSAPAVELVNSDEEEKLPVKTVSRATSSEHSGFLCDSCRCYIYGPRYCCVTHEIDLCFKCFRHGDKMLFKDHKFEKLTSSGERAS